MSKTGHRVLVVEDDPVASEITCEILRSRGDVPRAVATVEEALAAIDEEEVCCYVLDQQLPLDAKALKALITGGERVTMAARASDRRHNGETHVTPILVLSGYDKGGPQYVPGLFKRGIDAMVQKDVTDRIEEFTHELDEMLERAGRGDHANCAALLQRAPAVVAVAEASGPVVRLALDGRITKTGRTQVVINDTICEIQDRPFVSLFRCVAARSRGIDSWSTRDALGLPSRGNGTTRIRNAFEPLVPKGFEVVESDLRGNLRLNPAIVVERLDLDALALHPDPGVVRIAVEQRKNRGAR
jgi:CheY-like chemotaxis protein